MKKSFSSTAILSKGISKDKRKYFVFIILFLSGIFFGSLHSSSLLSRSQTNNFINTFLSAYSLHGVVKNDVFFLSFFNYFKFICILWLSGWHPLFFPLCFIQVFAKGFRIGYTISCFIRYYHFRGILLSVLTILPPNALFLPFMLFFSTYQFSFLSDRKAIRYGNMAHYKDCYCKNILYFCIFLFIISLCAVIEGYLTPVFIHPLCRFFH